MQKGHLASTAPHILRRNSLIPFSNSDSASTIDIRILLCYKMA